MNSSLSVITIACIVTVCVAVTIVPAEPVRAEWDNYSWAECATDEPVSLYLYPDGGGRPFTSAYTWYGGNVDATITVYLLDGSYDPIPGYPAEDIFLQWYGGDVVFCDGGNIADGPSDENGITTFTAAPLGGGCAVPDNPHGLAVVLNGAALLQPGFDIAANSPDLTGDLAVNIADVAAFTQLLFGNYDYRADYYWDEVINLSDVAIFAQGLGIACP